MRIKKLVMKNFGRHALLDADTDSPVVGLLGPNGSGKTTVLVAVEYLLTGNLVDNNTSYVRHGAKKFELYMEFEKDGVDGSIYRSVLASGAAKRELKWDGDTYTTDADVRRILEAVLDADEAALHNALFVSQGNMASLLSGTQTPREDMYMKMLLVSYLEKRAQALEKKAKAVGAEMVDLTALSDAAEAAVAGARQQRDELETRLAASLDPAPGIKVWRTLRDYRLKLDDANSSIAVLRQERNDLAGQLAAAGAEHEALFNEGGLCEPDAQRERDGLSASISKALKDKAAAAALQELSNRVAAFEAELAMLDGELSEIDFKCSGIPSMAELETRLKEVGNREERKRVLDDLAASRERWKKSKDDKEALLQALVEKGAPEDDQAKRDRLSSIRKDLLLYGEAAKRGASVCWTCGQPLPADAAYPSRKAAMELEEKELSAWLSSYEAASKSYQGLLTSYTADAASASAELKRLSALVVAKAAEAAAAPPAESRKGLETMKRERISLDARAGTLSSRKAYVSKACEESKGAMEAAREAGEAAPVSDAVVREMEVRMGVLDGLLSRMRSLSLVKANLDAKLAAGDKAMAERTAAADALAAGIAEMRNGMPPWFSRIVGEAGVDAESESDPVGARLDAMAAERSELSGRLKHSQGVLEGAKAEAVAVARRVEADRLRTEVAGSLKRLRDVFSRDGLALKYTQARFMEVADVVQEHLERMEADFAVMADPDIPVHFLFCRLDDEQENWMPQGKLSGGQAVRLSIALLLAIQQEIMPGLGFLVLDEPSMHLDEAGVQSLREVLAGMQGMLQNTKAQIWICDHNKELESALGRVVRLA
jgi:DNA repair exonuclease SbcCD ATPase subunit